MKKLLWIIPAGLVGLFVLNNVMRADYLEFDRQREAWHRKCDVYRGKINTGEDKVAADACRREMQEMMSYAERKGWR